MSDYTQITDYSAKDALSSGDAEKIILGADIDAELAAISTAIATKYDSNDLASQAQAEAETLNTVLITPLRLANWADANGGLVGDIQALADPGADTILGWDDSAGAAINFTLGAGIEASTTTIRLDSNIFGVATSSELQLDSTLLDINNTTVDMDGTTWTADYTTATLTGGSAVITLSGTEIDLTASTLDLNGALSLSGAFSMPGMVFNSSGINSHIYMTATGSSDPLDRVYLDKNADTFRIFMRDDSTATFYTLFDWAHTSAAVGGTARFGVTSSLTEFEVNASSIDFNGAADISSTLDVTGVTTLKSPGVRTTAALRIATAAHAAIYLEATPTGGPVADSSNWEIRGVNRTDGTAGFQVLTATDADGAGSSAIDIYRSGTTVTEIELNATTLDFNGVADFSSSITAGGNIQTNGASGAFVFSNDTNTGVAWVSADVLGIVTGGSYRAQFSSAEIDLTATAIDINGATNIAGGLNAEPESRSITDTGNTASTDQGIVIRMTSGSSKTFTLDGDPPTDAVVVLDNSSGNSWTIAASGTLIWAATAGTGNRTLADDGMAVAIHRGSGVWVINGGGLS